MITVEQAVTRHGVDIDPHLDRQATIPVSRFARQGDIIVVPAAMIAPVPVAATRLVPSAGVAVVRGENGGNTHMLLAEGDVRYDAVDAGDTGLRLGLLTVAPDAVGFLAHPEHGYVGVAPGTYEIRRQREQADEIRLVAD